MKCPYAKKQEYICSECHNSIFYYTECCKSITEPMTNEEWFDGLSTEEKATWLDGVIAYCFGVGHTTESEQKKYQKIVADVEMWLKQPHIDKE